MSEQFSLDGLDSSPAALAEFSEADFKTRFASYWAENDVMWGAERLHQTVVGIMKEILVRSRQRTINAAQIAAMKHAADIGLKLLNKHMPDMKAIEMTGTAGMSQEDALELLAAGIRAAEQAGATVSPVLGDVPPNTH